jgi:hypothetical protein
MSPGTLSVVLIAVVVYLSLGFAALRRLRNLRAMLTLGGGSLPSRVTEPHASEPDTTSASTRTPARMSRSLRAA